MKRQQQLTIAVVCGLIIAVLGATTIATAQGQPQVVTVQVMAENNSGISGTATLAQMANAVRVDIRVNGAGAGPVPSHIHRGTCAQPDATPQYTLLSVTNGASTTDVQTTLQSLIASPYAIHMHQSADELSVMVACADIAPGALPRTGEAESSVNPIATVLGLTLVAAGLVLRLMSRRRRNA